MHDKTTKISTIARKYEAVISCLSEKGRRLWAAAEASSYGHGGISLVCQATGLARSTIHRGLREIQNPSGNRKHIRNPGGGRKKSTYSQKDLIRDLESLGIVQK